MATPVKHVQLTVTSTVAPAIMFVRLVPTGQHVFMVKRIILSCSIYTTGIVLTNLQKHK